MSGKWVGYFTAQGDDLVPHVVELESPAKDGVKTRSSAIAVLRRVLTRKQKEGQEEAAEATAKANRASRALAALFAMEKKP